MNQREQDDLNARLRARAMNLPRMVRCDHCSMPYYQTSAPHVCAGWTTKEKKMNRNTTGYPVIDQILESIAPSGDTKRIMDTPIEEWCECKHALYSHGEDDFHRRSATSSAANARTLRQLPSMNQ